MTTSLKRKQNSHQQNVNSYTKMQNQPLSITIINIKEKLYKLLKSAKYLLSKVNAAYCNHIKIMGFG